MTDLLSYSLGDFLLFSLPAYFGIFEQINAAFWPGAHMVSLLVGLAIAGVLCWPAKWSSQVVYGVLAIVWAWTGWYFVALEYVAINWAVTYVVPAFFAQTLLFACAALSGRGLALQERPLRPTVLMFVFAVIIYPASSVILGRPWQAAEVFGLSPDPLVAATLAVLPASKGWLLWTTWILPLAWVALSGLTLWMLGSADWILLPTFALLCVVMAIRPSLTR